MENITFNMSELHQYGTAYFDYLALRKHFFVDTLGWDIPHNDIYEMDQYDNPLAYYSLVLRDGKVIGGARGMPTTSSWGDYTYMLRDAVQGKLAEIPKTIMGDEIRTPKVWECTRLVISDDLETAEDRQKCLALVVDGLARTASKEGAAELIALMRPPFMRALRQLGYNANLIGKPYQNREDGRKYGVLSMSAKPVTRIQPAERPTAKVLPIHQDLELRQTA